MCKKIFINILLTSTVFLAACAPAQQAPEEFAKCLTDKGAKIYGAYSCSACAAQKEIFGESFKYINYIECDPHRENSKPETCIKKGIMSYPTWEFSDQSKKVGVQPLNELAKITNCELQADTTNKQPPA